MSGSQGSFPPPSCVCGSATVWCPLSRAARLISARTSGQVDYVFVCGACESLLPTRAPPDETRITYSGMIQFVLAAQHDAGGHNRPSLHTLLHLLLVSLDGQKSAPANRISRRTSKGGDEIIHHPREKLSFAETVGSPRPFHQPLTFHHVTSEQPAWICTHA